MDNCYRIKCQCGSIIKIHYCQETFYFQLSAFYKHVRDSNCLLMKTKKNNLKEINNNVNNLSGEIIMEDEEQNEGFTFDDDYDAGAAVLDELSIDKTKTFVNLNKRKQSVSNELRSTISKKRLKQ